MTFGLIGRLYHVPCQPLSRGVSISPSASCDDLIALSPRSLLRNVRTFVGLVPKLRPFALIRVTRPAREQEPRGVRDWNGVALPTRSRCCGAAFRDN
jgi:hypothetical protein